MKTPNIGDHSQLLTILFTAVFCAQPHGIVCAQESVTFTEDHGVLTETCSMFPTIVWRSISGSGETWVNPASYGVLTETITWREPDGEPGFNIIQGNRIDSDILTPITAPLPYGTPVLSNVMDSNGQLHSCNVQFVDLGDLPASVADYPSTLPLCCIACFSLVLARGCTKPHGVVM